VDDTRRVLPDEVTDLDATANDERLHALSARQGLDNRPGGVTGEFC
jgi:hypothetical protein